MGTGGRSSRTQEKEKKIKAQAFGKKNVESCSREIT